MRFRPARLLALLAALPLVALLQGCGSATLKGTPFYTGEYEKREGPAEDRVNLWPLLYYRDPALSVLWPLLEHTDDHAAVRPLFSVYGLGEERREYNVLWPLAQFDRKNASNRIFPVFWGDDYVSIFPLYYHWNDPFGASGGTDALFPLWIYTSQSDSDYSFHALWPLAQVKRDYHSEGFRVWPLYASWDLPGDDYYGWYAWPLGWRWGDNDEHNRLLAPLFWQRTAPKESAFATLLAGWRSTEDSLRGYALPIGYYHQEEQGTEGWYTLLGGRQSSPEGSGFWYATPALAWGSWRRDRSSTWIGGPLYHRRTGPDSSTSHLMPVYYRNESRDESLFVSLPYSSRRTAEASWRLVPPLWFHYEDKAGEFSVTPLYAWGRDLRTGKDWSAVPPVYYRRDDEAGATFISPLYSAWTGESGSRNTLVPPLLSYYRDSEKRNDLWTLGGLGHLSWGEEAGSSYLFPVYYGSAGGDTAVSPLWAQWSTRSGRTIRLIPPLLSWSAEGTGHTSYYPLLGLAKLNRGEEADDSWIFPLYYRNPKTESFLSLPYAQWTEGERTTRALPLLLSSYAETDDERSVRLLLGLYGRTWSADESGPSSSWLFPLYANGDDYFVTPLAGQWKDGGTAFTYATTPLFGWRSGATTGSWLFPFYFYRHERATDRRHLYYFPWGSYDASDSRTGSSLFPFYSYSNDRPLDIGSDTNRYYRQGRSWHVLYLAAYENMASYAPGEPEPRRYADNRFFPLWHYERTLTREGRLEKEFSLLFFLQDYQRKRDASAGHDVDYTRARVLWRVVHYERDHDTVSTDIFPAITYDRDSDKMKKVSFLWRGFRYERNAEGKAVDVLFVPVWRTGWVGKE